MYKIAVAVCAFMLMLPQTGLGAENITKENLKQEVRKILQQNPEILLDVLKEHSETILDIAQQGSTQRRKRNLEAQWKEDLKQKKTVELKDRPVLGPKNALVTIVAFSDFTCPYCEQGANIVRQIMQSYKGQVRLIFKHMPLMQENVGVLASKYFIAASLQNEDKAWQLYDRMFMNRDRLITEGEAFLQKNAETIGLNMEKLRSDVKSKKVEKILNEDLNDAKKLNIEGTPYFLVNDLVIRGALPQDLFKGAIDMALKNK